MLIYRKFKSSDAESVYLVAIKSWKATYKEIFSSEFIIEFVGREYNPDNLRNIIPQVNAGWTGFWVAEDINFIVGFAQVGYSSMQLEKKDPKNEIYLYRIYIDPEYLNRGVGSNLLHLVEEWVKNEQKDQYGCYCHKNNFIGKQFYYNKKFEHIQERDNPEENEIFLLKKIK